MKFQYTARTQQGELQTGFVESATRDSAAAILLGHNLFVLSLNEANRRLWYAGITAWLNRVRPADLMVFTRQFATLLESKIPLTDAMRSLYKQTANPLLKEAVYEIFSDINAGLSVSQAMERQPHIFNNFYVAIVRSAEITGTLHDVMGFLADYVDRQVMWRTRIRNALIYPSILFALFFVVAAIMLFTVLPQIEPIFKESNVELPWITIVFLSAGNFILDWWWVALSGLALLVPLVIDYVRSDEGRMLVNDWLIEMPIVGSIFKKMYVAQFAESLRVLMKGAVPMTQAIEISGHSIQNFVYRDILRDVAEGVKRGELLSAMLQQYEDYFPPLVSQMIAIAESTGRLEEILGRIAALYARETNNLIDNLLELIQPILIAVIGVFVGLLFASILIPIYNLAKAF